MDSMKTFALLISLVAVNAGAQGRLLGSQHRDEVISSHDGKGHISTVVNAFDGYYRSIIIRRLNAQGQLQWEDQHRDGLDERAHASSMHEDATLYVVGERRVYGHSSFLIMKFHPDGGLLWEYTDSQHDCRATATAVDAKGDLLIAGTCEYGGIFPARIVKYGANGALLWEYDYNAGGLNLVKAIHVEANGNTAVSLEVRTGDGRGGSYFARTIVFNENGWLIGER